MTHVSQPPKSIFIFDNPRTRSNLFFRFLSTHPDLEPFWSPFKICYTFGPERTVLSAARPPEILSRHSSATFSAAGKSLHDAYIQAQRDGRILLANEHSFIVLNNKWPKQGENITAIPDDMFEDLTPIFLIRNPVVSVPSFYRVNEVVGLSEVGSWGWDLNCDLGRTSALFEFFWQKAGKEGTPPIVVDGDDIIWRTDELGRKLSKSLNIRENLLSSTWGVTPEHDRSKEEMVRGFLKDIYDSSGIIRLEQQTVPDLDEAHTSWKGEFGEEVAKTLRTTVENNIGHYEFLKQFKL